MATFLLLIYIAPSDMNHRSYCTQQWWRQWWRQKLTHHACGRLAPHYISYALREEKANQDLRRE